MLRPQGINYSVLNAKNHAAESQIIKDAGKNGAVTIATNMAGRGTDIKLGKGVVKGKHCYLTSGDGECAYWEEEPGRCLKEVPCGLYIVGTERHEARRIDDQLRGRSGRQGDPGSSRFFLCLEDDLMRLFGSDRVASIMDRMGQKEMEPIESPLVTRAIAGAQKRVEVRNAEMRKHLLDYDDVMNKQREVIYHLRDQILGGTLDGGAGEIADSPDDEAAAEDSDDRAETGKVNLKQVYQHIAREAIEDMVAKFTVERRPEDWDWTSLHGEYVMAFLTDFELKPEERGEIRAETLVEHMNDQALLRFDQRRQQLGDELFGNLLKVALLRTLDARWRDHLYALDMVREGINLRAYGQKDPLIEYKQESFKMFDETMTEYRREAITFLFRAEIRGQPPPVREPSRPLQAYKPQATVEAEPGTQEGQQAEGRKPPAARPVRRAEAKVGRNDPCPCGSGRKYKKCCGKNS